MTTDRDAPAQRRDSAGSRWTARVENGETIYEQPTTGVETTDTEFVERRTHPEREGST